MADRPRSGTKTKTKLGVIARLGERLSSEERAPYELSDHDDALLFDEPTADQVVPADRTTEPTKRGPKGEP